MPSPPHQGPDEPAEITRLLHAHQRGDASAVADLMPLIHGQLRRLADAQFRAASPHTWQPTDLVHEAWLKLFDRTDALQANDRSHFLAIAARAMRQLLVNHARDRKAEKRGGDAQRVTLATAHAVDGGLDCEELHEALQRLGRLDARQAAVVELRFFGGLTVEETAQELDCSAATIERDWRTARAWLGAQLQGGTPE